MWCSRCNLDLPEDVFGVDRGRSRGRNTYCLECDALCQMCRRYRTTVEEYLDLLEKQNGACAICGEQERMILKKTGRPRRLSVDHDHVSGQVRGLLCGPCNQALGQFRDDSQICLKAADYLISRTPSNHEERLRVQA